MTFLASIIAFTMQAASANGFLADFPDVPVMAGLVEDENARMVFDKAEGRILETRLTGPGQTKAATDFYQDSLIALGWTLIRQDGIEQSFARDNDLLTIRYEKSGEMVVLSLFLEPRRTSSRN